MAATYKIDGDLSVTGKTRLTGNLNVGGHTIYGANEINVKIGDNQIPLAGKMFNRNAVYFGSHSAPTTILSSEARPRFETNGDYLALVSDTAKMTETTWAALKALRDGGNLVPGMQYRITDYQCTTTTANTSSAGHQFDIIVVADSASVLNENARAALHVGDTYFTNNKLEAWKLKYCIDNDTNRFAWADATNGKGVIYWMRDEFGNEAPYDFKNVWFERDIYEETGTMEPPSGGSGTLISGKEVFTFNAWDYDNDRCIDASLINRKQVIDDYANVCEYNSIKPYHKSYVGSDSIPQYLNDIVLLSMFSLSNDSYFDISRNHFEENVQDITLNNDCCMNFFGSRCHDICLGSSSQNNKFDSGCGEIKLGVGNNANVFGINIRGSCGDYCNSNVFDGLNDFDLGEGCSYNHVGKNASIDLGTYCSYNVFKSDSHQITFGNSCSHNTIGSNCTSIWLGNYCECNIFHDGCSWVSIGTMGSPINYCRYNEIDSGAYSLQIICPDTSASESNQLQYIHVHSGIKGAVGRAKTITVPDRNLNYTIDYYATGSEQKGLTGFYKHAISFTDLNNVSHDFTLLTASDASFATDVGTACNYFVCAIEPVSVPGPGTYQGQIISVGSWGPGGKLRFVMIDPTGANVSMQGTVSTDTVTKM